MVIPIITALGTVSKSLLRWLEELEIKGRAETIQKAALLRSARKLEIEGDLLSLKLQ